MPLVQSREDEPVSGGVWFYLHWSWEDLILQLGLECPESSTARTEHIDLALQGHIEGCGESFYEDQRILDYSQNCHKKQF